MADGGDYLGEIGATIREKWLAGMSDRDIGKLVNLSERAVRGRRYHLALIPENYPQRRSTHGRKGYTPSEEHDILTCRLNGKSVKSIAERYGVAERTMDAKVNQLLLRHGKPKYEPSSRTCLRCGSSFVSNLPRSINRICSTCRTEADWSV